MHLQIGVVQLLHNTLRYEVKVFEGGSKRSVFGWSEPTPAYTLGFLQEHHTKIESVEYWANASPVPKEALEVIAQIKEMVGGADE